MKFDLDTGRKVAVLVDGQFTSASAPLGPTGPDGAINAHFDAMLAELQPILDKYLPIDRGAGAAREQPAPRTAAQALADKLIAQRDAIRNEITALAARQASHEAHLEDAALVAQSEAALIAAQIAAREKRLADLEAQLAGDTPAPK